MAHEFAVVEKNNRHAVHGYFTSRETAERHIKITIPEYCRRGYFTDKTLTPDSFTIITREVK